MTTNKKSFLRFRDAGASPSGLTRIITVASLSDDLLGTIQWYAPWRRYTFKPVPGPWFDAACLLQIFEQLDDLMANHWGKKNVR
jgi:hypothetical protein